MTEMKYTILYCVFVRTFVIPILKQLLRNRN